MHHAYDMHARISLSRSIITRVTLPWSQLPNILDKLDVPYWRKEPVKTADKAASNHGISAMKFQLIRVGHHWVRHHWVGFSPEGVCGCGPEHGPPCGALKVLYAAVLVL